MDESYFDYSIDDISLFSQTCTIKSLKRRFGGYPFDEKSKEIISRLTEEKLKLEELTKQQKKISASKEFKTTFLAQGMKGLAGMFCWLTFFLFSLFITIFLIRELINIQSNSNLKFLFFFINLLSGTLTSFLLYLSGKNFKPGYKYYFPGFSISLVVFLTTFMWSLSSFPPGNYWKYSPTLYFSVLPFFLFPLSAAGAGIAFFLINIIVKLLHKIEGTLLKRKKIIILKKINEERKTIEKKILSLKTQEKLSDKVELIKELSLKHKHMFFPFNAVDINKEYEIIQANLAIAIGEYASGLNMIKNLLGDKIQEYPAYHFWQGIIATEKNEFKEAYTYLNRSLKMSQSLDTYLALCFLNIKNNEPELAESAMNKEPLLSYESPEKLFLKGLEYFIRQNFDRAELVLQKFLSVRPQDNTVKIILLLLFLRIKNYKKMVPVLKNFTGPKNIKDMFLGLAEYNQKNYKKAIEYFDRVSKKDTYNVEALCFQEMARSQKKVHSIFREKNLAQNLISRLPDNMEDEPIANYTIARLFQVEGQNKQAIEYLKKAYHSEPENPDITIELARFYFKSPYESELSMEVILKALPHLGKKKKLFRQILNHLFNQPEIPETILNLLEEQYFKNINYDPLMVKLLSKHHLKKNTMSEKSTEIYLKALDLNCLEEEEKARARKLIAWHDAESGNAQLTRDELYKNLLQEHSDDERILFLNCVVLNKKGNIVEENSELFKNILYQKYVHSRFWEIFNLNRDFILINLVKYYQENKIYTEDNGKIIEEAFDAFPRNKIALLAFGEYSRETGRYDEKSLRAYKEMYRDNPEDTQNLFALGKAYVSCNEIHTESMNVLEKIFVKGLSWDESIKVMTAHYIKRMLEGKLKKELIVLFVWGRYTEIEPEDYNVRFYIAEEFYERKDYLQAYQKYEEVISIFPQHRNASLHLGECYMQMGKIQEATETFKKILHISDKDDLEALKKLGKIYLDIHKDEKEAIIYYERASEIDKTDLETLKILLELYKKERNQENMIKIQEKITSLEQTGENLATLGHFYLKTNRLEDGISRLQEAIKKGFEARGKVHMMIAEAKYYMIQEKSSREDCLELINILTEALSLGWRDKKIYEMRYQIYLKIGDKKKAAEDRKIFAPDDLDNLYQLARENKNDMTYARETLMQIYRKDRDFLDVSLQLARIYSQEKSFDNKHADIILYAFSSKTSQFLRNDEDNRMIEHIHNYYKLKKLFSEEISFLNEILKHKHPYNEGKLKSWIALCLMEQGLITRAYEILDGLEIGEAREELLDAHIRLAEELLFKEQFKEAEEVLEKIYLAAPTFKNVGNLLENLRKERIGRFALLEPIGSGANATVYKAFDLVTRNFVAVKRLHLELQDEKEAVSNFKKEYEILEEFIHPGVAKVIPGSFNKNFFALELLDKTLSGVLEKNKDGLELNEFFSIATQIVEALHYMHSKNIIYHDLAPDNVMFAGEIVKFCDLGGAKRFDLKTRQTIVASTEKHYLYASPEQCKHEFDPSVRVDHRSDIYSLGALMFHMLCGIPPFIGPDQALISAHQHSKPSPVLSQKDNIPRQLTSIILKALEKNPDDRQQSMEDLLQELMQTPRI